MSFHPKVLAAVLAFVAWGMVQVAASQIAGFQRERAVLSLESLGPVCGSVLLTSSAEGTRPRPVAPNGSYVVEPRGGGADVAVSHGVVAVRLQVLRGERVHRETEVEVRAGEKTSLRAGLFRVRAQVSPAPAPASGPCGGIALSFPGS